MDHAHTASHGLPLMGRISPAHRRALLLHAGSELWASDAYDAISSAEITAATGVSVGLVYHHFGSKRGFYTAVIQDAVDRLIAATEPAAGVPLAGAVPDVMRGFLRFVEDNDRLYVAVLRGGLGMDAEIGAIVERARTVNCDRIFAAMEVSPTDLQRTAVYGWVGFSEAVGLEHAQHRRHDSEALVELLTGALLKVLG